MTRARRSFEPEGYYASAWFVHQAIEKGLKDLFIERFQAQAARTQDLIQLSAALAVPQKVITHIPMIDRAFDLTRYPDIATLVAPVDGVTEATARTLLQAAEEVMTWLEAQLPSNSTQQ